MHFASNIAPLLVASIASAVTVQIHPYTGNDCEGDSLPTDKSGNDSPLHYCFDISDADSFAWHHQDSTASGHDFAKFTYYSETGCSGDVTAVKVLCGIGFQGGTCYNKHDANAGSVFVENQGNDRGCDFWEEGEKECDPQGDETASPPPCGVCNFPGGNSDSSDC